MAHVMTRDERQALITWYRHLLLERRAAAQRAWDNGAGYVVSNPEGEDHFAYWRPGEVLPELEARLTLLRKWEQAVDEMVWRASGLEAAVRLLASAHTADPGYDQRWLPE
jgi:Family of unknown function (DUF6221)